MNVVHIGNTSGMLNAFRDHVAQSVCSAPQFGINSTQARFKFNLVLFNIKFTDQSI